MNISGVEHKVGDKVWAICAEAKLVQTKPRCEHCGNGPTAQYRNMYKARQYQIVSIVITVESPKTRVRYYCSNRDFDSAINCCADDQLNRAFKTKAAAQQVINKLNKAKEKQ